VTLRSALEDVNVVDLHISVAVFRVPSPLPVGPTVVEVDHRRHIVLTVAPRLLEVRVTVSVNGAVRDEPVRAADSHVQHEMKLYAAAAATAAADNLFVQWTLSNCLHSYV
jgi:hypothetical protein